jgi:hypothetical protein
LAGFVSSPNHPPPTQNLVKKDSSTKKTFHSLNHSSFASTADFYQIKIENDDTKGPIHRRRTTLGEILRLACYLTTLYPIEACTGTQPIFHHRRAPKNHRRNHWSTGEPFNTRKTSIEAAIGPQHNQVIEISCGKV